jgi:hypothetical protein
MRRPVLQGHWNPLTGVIGHALQHQTPGSRKAPGVVICSGRKQSRLEQGRKGKTSDAKEKARSSGGLVERHRVRIVTRAAGVRAAANKVCLASLVFLGFAFASLFFICF